MLAHTGIMVDGEEMMVDITSTLLEQLIASGAISTAKATRQYLQNTVGLYGAALDFAVQSFAPDRHERRTQATLVAAMERSDAFLKLTKEEKAAFFSKLNLSSPWGEESSQLPLHRAINVAANVAWVILADLNGVGGIRGMGGASKSTQRLLKSNDLGTGRWHAADGAAYKAAAVEALERLGKLLHELTGGKFSRWVANAEGGNFTFCGELTMSCYLTYAWEEAILLRCFDALLKGQTSLDVEGVTLHIEGSIKDWGEVINEN